MPLPFAQTHLHESTYVPLSAFYDLSAWSAPLMENTPGGWSSAPLAETLPALRHARALNLTAKVAELRLQPAAAVAAAADALRAGSIVVLQQTEANPGESFDWLSFTMRDRWGLGFTSMLPDDFGAPGALDGVDVVVVPHVTFAAVLGNLGENGRAAITAFVEGGGHFVGWQGGAQLSGNDGLGISMVDFFSNDATCPGSFFRVLTDASHPLCAGVGSETFMYMRDNMNIMNTGQHRLVGYFPFEESADWFVSGYEQGAGPALQATTAVHQRTTGAGLVTSFAFEVNFRAFTAGTSKMVYNAIMQSTTAHATNTTAADAAFSRQYQTALAAAGTTSTKQTAAAAKQRNATAIAIDWSRNVQLTIPYWTTTANVSSTTGTTVSSLEAKLAAALHSIGGQPPVFVREYTPPIAQGQGQGRGQDRRRVYLLPNPTMLDVEEHPWFGKLATALEGHGVAGARLLF
jgi:hypothetical protein